MLESLSSRQKYAAVVVLVLIVAGVGALGLIGNDSGGQVCNIEVDNSDADTWKEFELVDVSSCETYTVSELEKPVLVESFAVWCTTCTKQQLEVQKLHENTDVRSVSLNTDPNEDEAKIQQHLDRHGFEWRYSVAPSSMIRDLVNQFGREVTVAPRAPVVLVCEDGSRKLPSGVKPVSKLQEEIKKGC